MEYSVGSLADLITGKNTPNKPKVVQKALKKKVKSSSELEVEETPVTVQVSLQKKSKGKKRKRQSDEVPREVAGDFVDSDDKEELNDAPKKKKLSENDHNAERRIKQKNKIAKADPQLKERTIFVGNIPINTPKKKIQKHFKKYGKIESIRIRGIPVADPKTPKKVAAIKKEFHPDRNTVYSYIRFVNKEDAEKAEVENGTLFQEHHLRVHLCESTEKPDESKAIFVGNLSFEAEEEELWKLFEPCGPISHVRIVRDTYTGMGKGFGYVNFKDADAVQLALEMENVTLKNRDLRISLCNLNMAKKNKKKNKKKQITQAGKPKSRWHFDNKSNKNKEGKSSQKEKPLANGEFQGSKFNDKKKKKKTNKALLEKKKLGKKLAPKSKS